MTRNNRVQWRRLSAEAAAIVASILLAFSIDAWWDRTKQETAEAEWFAAIYLDITTTLNAVDVSIGEAEVIIEAAEQLLRLLSSANSPDVSTIHDLFQQMITPIGFTPTLPGFERGFSEGRFSGANSVEFRRGLADFRQWHAHLELSRRLDWEIYFIGPLYEVRAPHGGLQLLFGGLDFQERFKMSEEQYLEAILTPEMLAAVQTMGMAQENQLWALQGMRGAIENMVSALDERNP
jgi:hypothetical protein